LNFAGECTSGNTCRIFDFTLKNTGTNYYNRSGNGNTANSAFTNGAACPAEVAGSTAITDLNQVTAHTFLPNAVEIVGDGLGNDNGLCESGEACIYTPNIGFYQGTGNYSTNSCIFSNGTVSNVIMYGYPTN
jgi:hypothetical protein